MKKQAASIYKSLGRQNLPLDRRTLVTDATGDKIVRAVPQNFTDAEKAIARNNIGAGGGGADGCIRYDIPQELTAVQAEQARANMSVMEWDTITGVKLARWTPGFTYDSFENFNRHSVGDDPVTPVPYPDGAAHMYCFRYVPQGEVPTGKEEYFYLPTLHIARTKYGVYNAPTYQPSGTHVYEIVNGAWRDVTNNPSNESGEYGPFYYGVADIFHSAF